MRRISINHCIYCGAAGETDEHVVPLALGGDEILENASCETCRAITSKWEQNAIHDHWSGARAVLDYPSRRRRWETERFPLDVTTNNGRRMVLELSRRDLLGLAPFLQYLLPAFLTPDTSYMSGSVICGTSLVAFGANLEDLKQRYGIREIHYHVTYKGNHFENMLARIAYCAAIAEVGVNGLCDRYVLPAICGRKDDIGYWMGCDRNGEIVPSIGTSHQGNVVRIRIHRKDGDPRRYVVAQLKFFAASDAPEYIVVVGTLSPAAVLGD